MKAAFLLGAALLAASANGARAQASWPVVYRSGNVIVALDSSNAKRNADGSYLMRTRWDYAKLHALESKRPYMAMTQSALIRCTPVRIKRLTESFYSANGAVVREGSPPKPENVQYMTWDRLKVGSDASRAYTAACAMLKRRDRAR
jgi:hypothetical protein